MIFEREKTCILWHSDWLQYALRDHIFVNSCFLLSPSLSLCIAFFPFHPIIIHLMVFCLILIFSYITAIFCLLFTSTFSLFIGCYLLEVIFGGLNVVCIARVIDYPYQTFPLVIRCCSSPAHFFLFLFSAPCVLHFLSVCLYSGIIFAISSFGGSL